MISLERMGSHCNLLDAIKKGKRQNRFLNTLAELGGGKKCSSKIGFTFTRRPFSLFCRYVYYLDRLYGRVYHACHAHNKFILYEIYNEIHVVRVSKYCSTARTIVPKLYSREIFFLIRVALARSIARAPMTKITISFPLLFSLLKSWDFLSRKFTTERRKRTNPIS